MLFTLPLVPLLTTLRPCTCWHTRLSAPCLITQSHTTEETNLMAAKKIPMIAGDAVAGGGEALEV